MTTVSLDGAWQIKPYYGMDWVWRDPHKPLNKDPRHWVNATVPGSITHDVWQAGEIPTPYFERNSLLLEWIPARTWVYRRAFTLEESLRGQRAQLRFEGIDYEAQIFLNGELVGRHASAVTAAVFEVGALLNYGGDNLLAVVLEPAPPEQPQVSRTSLVRTQKSRMTYWWDFCPRMPHLGLFDHVALHFSGAARIDDVFVQPALTDDFTRAEVHVAVAVGADEPVEIGVEAVVRLDAKTVATAAVALAAGEKGAELALTIEHPALWWPNGQGEQPLYQAEVRVWAGHTLLDEKTVRFGIRRIDLIQNEDAEPGARPYTFVVNGRRIYLKGWNWVPIDVLYGPERADKRRRLLELAQAAHVNLLRVWGGGLLEKEAFYDLCDELGLMVWQEFILSSSGIENVPASDPAYVAHLSAEASAMIPRRRNHPSLALWCGGNELIGPNDTPLDESHPAIGALHDAVRRHDPDRLWLPASPSGRVASNTLENIRRDPAALHDVHGPWEYQGTTAQHTLYNAGASLLHSEFGVEGITNLGTLNATIAPEHQAPVSLENPVWHHLGAWWLKERVWREVWGDGLDVPALVRAAQFMQAEGLRYALEADRRRKYHNSGTLPWQFNEPYPMAACTSAVDYYARPKPVYYAVKHAYELVHVSAKFAASAWAGLDDFSAELWANNSHDEALGGLTLTARVLALDGQVCAEQTASVTLAPDSAARLGNITLPLASIATEVFFLDLALTGADGVTLSRNRYTFSKGGSLAPLLQATKTILAVESAGDTLTIRNTGADAALAVWVEDGRPVEAPGGVFLSEAYFALLPGEERLVRVRWQGVPETERRITVSGMNIDEWNG